MQQFLNTKLDVFFPIPSLAINATEKDLADKISSDVIINQ